MPNERSPNERSDDEKQRDAVDAATSDRLGSGVIHDAHGEFQLDPELGDSDPPASDPNPDVVDHERDEAEAIEGHQERAADETRGALTKERPE